DGNIWFTENRGDRVGRITPGGVITEFPLPASYTAPWNITAGPDGNLWFVVTGYLNNRVGHISPNGVFEFVPEYLPCDGITAGPDGNIWCVSSSEVNRITPSGVVTSFPVPTPYPDLIGIASGVDGNLWFTEWVGNKIGRITPDGV